MRHLKTYWNGTLGIGNPAGAHIVKKYLEAVKLEQSLAAITPKHAIPLFVDKLIKVSRLIRWITDSESSVPICASSMISENSSNLAY
jgi:hypothetical protein